MNLLVRRRVCFRPKILGVIFFKILDQRRGDYRAGRQMLADVGDDHGCGRRMKHRLLPSERATAAGDALGRRVHVDLGSVGEPRVTHAGPNAVKPRGSAASVRSPVTAALPELREAPPVAPR